MKIQKIKDHYQKDFDEYVLGPHEFGNEIGYMAWGEVPPGGKRHLSTGHGHEEIILVIEGQVIFENGGGAVKPGEAFYVPSGGEVTITAGDKGCTYVTAGAHVEEEGHEH